MALESIQWLILGLIVILSLLTLAGVLLPARSFTTLVELIQNLGSLVIQQQQEHRQVVMRSLDVMERLSSSVLNGGTHTTPVGVVPPSEENGALEIKSPNGFTG